MSNLPSLHDMSLICYFLGGLGYLCSTIITVLILLCIGEISSDAGVEDGWSIERDDGRGSRKFINLFLVKQRNHLFGHSRGIRNWWNCPLKCLIFNLCKFLDCHFHFHLKHNQEFLRQVGSGTRIPYLFWWNGCLFVFPAATRYLLFCRTLPGFVAMATCMATVLALIIAAAIHYVPRMWRTLKSLNVAEVSGKFFLWRSFSWEEFTYGTGSFEIQSFACSTVKCGYREWFCTGNVEWLRSLLTILWTHLLSILDLSHHGCAWKCGRSPGKKNQSQPPKLAAGASVIASVSETNSSPLKMDGWNTTFLLWRPIFRGHVSFREGNVLTSIFLPPNGGSMLHENAQRHQWIWRFELDSQSSRRRCQCLVCTEWHWSGFFFGESLCYSCCHYHFSLKSFKPYGDSCGFAPRQIQVPCKTVSWI